jgi:hypothetical protein
MNKIVSTDFITDDVQRLVPVDATATTPKNAAVAKLMKAWEAKTTQRTAKGAGLTLLAVSLAACNDDSTAAIADTDTDTDTDTAVVAQTFTLTTGTDAVTGGAGDDAISGARVDTVQTLNSGDTINGGAGSDTLTANLNAGSIAPTISNVETIQLTNTSSATLATVDFVNVTGVTSIINSASSFALTVDNVVAITPVTIQNTAAATTIIFKDAALAGTADAVTLNLNSVSGGIITIGSESAGTAAIETVNIVATGTNVTGDVAFGTTATTLNISGTGSIDISAGVEFAAVQTIDASGLTGGLQIALAGDTARTDSATIDLNITTGAGDDDVDLGVLLDADVDNIIVDLGAGNDRIILDANTDTGNSISGGAGTDTLQLDIAMTATTAAYVDGFEILEFNGRADLTQDMDLADGINVVNIFDMTAGTNDLNIDDAADGLIINANGALLAGTGTATNADMTILSVDLKTDTGSDDLTLNLNAAAGGVTIANFVPNVQYETVTVNSSGTAGNEILSIGSAKVNMIFTGATALTVTSTGSLLGVADAAGMTGVFTTTTSTTAITVTGGSGKDVITSGQLATGVTQTLNGGDGNDTLTAGQILTTGNLVLNGGAGSPPCQ